jgi:hypothetical protein
LDSGVVRDATQRELNAELKAHPRAHFVKGIANAKRFAV